MARYFYDTEFLEGTQKSFFGQSKPTIDLISIGIVSEDNREYYAVSKDFNLKEAWNRWEHNEEWLDGKYYWIRENVLRPIFNEWMQEYNGNIVRLGLPIALESNEFTYKNFKKWLKLKGKSNKQIAKDICSFIDARGKKENPNDWFYPSDGSCYPKEVFTKNVELYGYYSAYDHVALCWLFGKMIDLPKGFPKYTIDTKQEYDILLNGMNKKYDFVNNENEKATVFSDTRVDFSKLTIQEKHNIIKTQCSYPQNTNQHNALDDAKWTRDFYNFIQSLNYNKANRHF